MTHLARPARRVGAGRRLALAAARGRSRRRAPELRRRAPRRRRARASRGVERDRQAVARRLGQPDAARDDRLEDASPEMPARPRRRRRRTGSSGRRTWSARRRRSSSRGFRWSRTRLMRGDQLGQSLQRVVLALDRDEHGVGGGQRVDGQQPERRRAVDEDVVVVGRRSAASESREPPLALLERGELDLGAGQRDRRRDEVEAVDGPCARSGPPSWTPSTTRVVDRALDAICGRSRSRSWRCPADRDR